MVEVLEPEKDVQDQLEGLASVAQGVERLADRWLFYTDEGDLLLEKIRAIVPPGCVWLRGATLEDVFLSLTGRGLLD